MSKNTINYLLENKSKFSREILIDELRKAGYEEKDIIESVNMVYDNVSMQDSRKKPTSFWDFKNKKLYINKVEKIVNFIVGMLLPWLTLCIIAAIEDDLAWLTLFIYIALLIYFKSRRYYIYRGLLINLIILAVIVAIGFSLLLLNISMFRF